MKITDELLRKLDLPVEQAVKWNTPLATALSENGVIHLIDLYRRRLSRPSDSTLGMNKKSALRIENALKELGLPSTSTAANIVRLYEATKQSKKKDSWPPLKDRSLVTVIVIGMLKALGYKHDSETVAKVIDIAKP